MVASSETVICGVYACACVSALPRMRALTMFVPESDLEPEISVTLLGLIMCAF